MLCKDGPLNPQCFVLFNAPTFLTPMIRATSSGEDSVQSWLGYSEHILFAEVLRIMSQTQQKFSICSPNSTVWSSRNPGDRGPAIFTYGCPVCCEGIFLHLPQRMNKPGTGGVWVVLRGQVQDGHIRHSHSRSMAEVSQVAHLQLGGWPWSLPWTQEEEKGMVLVDTRCLDHTASQVCYEEQMSQQVQCIESSLVNGDHSISVSYHC